MVVMIGIPGWVWPSECCTPRLGVDPMLCWQHVLLSMGACKGLARVGGAQVAAALAPFLLHCTVHFYLTPGA